MAGEPTVGIRGLGSCEIGPAAGVRRLDPAFLEAGIAKKSLLIIEETHFYDRFCDLMT